MKCISDCDLGMTRKKQTIFSCLQIVNCQSGIVTPPPCFAIKAVYAAHIITTAAVWAKVAVVIQV